MGRIHGYRRRTGSFRNGQSSAAPTADLIPVADGYVVLSAYTADKFLSLCRLLGQPELAADDRFRDHGGRVHNRPELLAILADALRDYSRADAVSFLSVGQIVCGAVKSFSEIAKDPDVVAGGALARVNGAPEGADTVPQTFPTR